MPVSSHSPIVQLPLSHSHLSLFVIFFIYKHSRRFHRWRKLTPLPDGCPIFPEYNGNRDEQDGDAAEECARPINVDCVEHVHGEQREDGAGEGTQEGVGSYC